MTEEQERAIGEIFSQDEFSATEISTTLDMIEKDIHYQTTFMEQYDNVDWGEVFDVIKSVLVLFPEDGPANETVRVRLGALAHMDIHISKWLPKGEIWMLEAGQAVGRALAFAYYLQGAIRGPHCLMNLFPDGVRTGSIIQMFQDQMRKIASARIVNVAMDDLEEE